MNGIFKPFREPVRRKGDEHDQADDLALSTTAHSFATSWVLPWMVLYVNGDEGDGEPCAERCCYDSADEADQVDMAIMLRDIDACLQYESTEWNARDPTDEANDREYTEDQEDNASAPVFSTQEVDG